MTSIVDTVFAVFTSVSEWIVEALASMTTVFYNEGSLTFLGVLSLCGLGVGVILLIFNIIRSIIRFK